MSFAYFSKLILISCYFWIIHSFSMDYFTTPWPFSLSFSSPPPSLFTINIHTGSPDDSLKIQDCCQEEVVTETLGVQAEFQIS